MPKKINNVFSQSQVLILKNIVNTQKQARDIFVWNEEIDKAFPEKESDTKIIQNPQMGKIILVLNKLIPEEIRRTLRDLSVKAGSPAEFHSATYTEYNLKYGLPELRFHKDKVNHFWMVDYQLESNTSWDIVVEGESFLLKDNDALAFYPGALDHGRPQKDFKEGEFVSMIFFDMVTKNKVEEEEF